jgi:hypothetical protein
MSVGDRGYLRDGDPVLAVRTMVQAREHRSVALAV